MDLKETNRGFLRGEFADRNGVSCSLQESSIADEEGCIWLGCNDIGLKKFEPGKGWSDVVLQDDAPHGIMHQANTRMHLTQTMVAELLPALTYFAEHGELPKPHSDEPEGGDTLPMMKEQTAVSDVAERLSLVAQLRERADAIVKRHVQAGRKIERPFTLEDLAADLIERQQKTIEETRSQTIEDCAEVLGIKADYIRALLDGGVK